MYSYSKTKGLFGGVSVEGTVIIERQDANRIAYGESVSVKQILSGALDAPDWSQVLVDQIEASTGMPYGNKWVGEDRGRDDYEGERGEYDDFENGKGAGNRTRSRGSSVGQGYAFEGIGSGSGGRGSPGFVSEKLEAGRRRAGSLLGPNADKDRDRAERPASKRSSSSFNPFSGTGSTTPKRNPVLSSSESYNAGLTWDSDGPMQPSTRPRSSTNPNRARAGSAPRAGDDEELWKGTFAKMAVSDGSRSRAGSNPPPRIPEDVPEHYDDDFSASSASRDQSDPFGENSNRYPSRGSITPPSNDPYRSSSPLRNGRSSANHSPIPKIAVKPGLDENDGYARAIGLFDFNATDPGDLGFSKGQVVTILGKAGGDWWKGRDTRGKEGIFPSNYVEVVQLPKEPKGTISRSELKARTPNLAFD
jgi:hypothetical protein